MEDSAAPAEAPMFWIVLLLDTAHRGRGRRYFSNKNIPEISLYG